MAENTTPAKCSEAVYEAARAAGLLIVTTSEEAAIQKFADAIREAVRLEYTRPIGGGLTPDDDALTNAYAEGRKDEAEQNGAAARLIDAWVAAHGKPIPWDKAVEITAIVNKLPDDERLRLLALAD